MRLQRVGHDWATFTFFSPAGLPLVCFPQTFLVQTCWEREALLWEAEGLRYTYPSTTFLQRSTPRCGQIGRTHKTTGQEMSLERISGCKCWNEVSLPSWAGNVQFSSLRKQREPSSTEKLGNNRSYWWSPNDLPSMSRELRKCSWKKKHPQPWEQREPCWERKLNMSRLIWPWFTCWKWKDISHSEQRALHDKFTASSEESRKLIGNSDGITKPLSGGTLIITPL